MIIGLVYFTNLQLHFIIIIEMSMKGTFASQKFNSALGLKSANKQETNLFNKIDVVTA